MAASDKTTPSPVPGSASRDARRAQLFAEALQLFAERGYHHTSIADIIERAGVARGTFYNYFKSKREIFGQLLDQLFDLVASAATPIVVGDGASIEGQVRDNIARIAGILRGNQAMTRVIMEQAVGLDREGNDQLAGFYHRVLERIERAVRAGQAMAIVRPGDPSVLAMCLLGMVKEVLFQQTLGTRSPSLDVTVEGIFAVVSGGALQRLPPPSS